MTLTATAFIEVYSETPPGIPVNVHKLRNDLQEAMDEAADAVLARYGIRNIALRTVDVDTPDIEEEEEES